MAANPLFSTKEFGHIFNRNPTTTPTSYWMDAGAAWEVSPTVLQGSTSTQRWISTAATNKGTITSASPISTEFVHEYYVTFVVSPSGGGTVAPGTNWYVANSPTTITATPNSGYTFSNWSGTSGITFSSSTSKATKMTVTASGTVTATFAA